MKVTVCQQIKTAMAKAFFASAYADQAEECEQPLRGEIMDQLPGTIDPAAIHAAETLTNGMLQANWPARDTRTLPHEVGLLLIFEHVGRLIAEHGGKDRELTPDTFGHYCAMQAMGHGVGLNDAFGSAVYDAIKVPYCEFGSSHLEHDYFNRG